MVTQNTLRTFEGKQACIKNNLNFPYCVLVNEYSLQVTDKLPTSPQTCASYTVYYYCYYLLYILLVCTMSYTYVEAIFRKMNI